MARRRYRRRRRRMRRRRRRIPKSLLGNSRVVKHKYCFAGQQLLDSNLAVVESFRLLSPVDPDVSELGLQQSVRGFNEMHTLFNNCQVLGAKVRLTWLPAAGAHNQIYWCTIDKLNQLGQPSPNLNEILNKRNVVYRYSMNNPGSTMTTTIVRKHSPKKFNDFQDYKDAEEYQCIPATQILAQDVTENYINFGYSTTHAGLGAIAVCDFAITIDYLIRWFGPVNPPESFL